MLHGAAFRHAHIGFQQAGRKVTSEGCLEINLRIRQIIVLRHLQGYGQGRDSRCGTFKLSNTAFWNCLPRTPDLVVAGINNGENLTVGVTISGTVGAALEGAAAGIPALAVSLEMSEHDYLTHAEEIDFEAAKYFTCYFAARLLAMPVQSDVDVLKVDVPRHATPATPWKLTRLSRKQYYVPKVPPRVHLDQSIKLGYEVVLDEGKPRTRFGCLRYLYRAEGVGHTPQPRSYLPR